MPTNITPEEEEETVVNVQNFVPILQTLGVTPVIL
jgi:hypothetical protein